MVALLTLFDIFRYGHFVFFVALHAVMMTGVFLEWRRDKRAFEGEKDGRRASETEENSGQKVSVIIPIHNESRRMDGLLQTLLAQDCPAEIIFVDDRSSDDGPAKLAQFAREARKRGVLECGILTLAENPGPNRKQYALSCGIALAKGDYFLFTDGDCEVPPGWIRAMARRMRDAKTGAVIGPVFKKKEGKGFFSLYQCYDHVVRYDYLAGAIGLGAAGGAFGNNLIIRRKALESIGGYGAVPPSPTEDAALISLIRKSGGYRVRAVCLPDAAVETAAERSWRAFVNQTLRWNNGGLFSPDAVTRFNYNLLMLIIAAGILAIPLLPFIPALWPMPLAVLIGMLLNNAAAFALFRARLPSGGLPVKLGYCATLLFMPVYLTLMTLMGYAGIKTAWKDEII
ncbi:MAG: glycosyltransferase [Treponema sp.]|jgi:cellulose synthase/poly-beta-1,6-N-acetylglucosamine synthase-like glycosyltransferase|nr:glycosyltransferase [Treponema sp.]